VLRPVDAETGGSPSGNANGTLDARPTQPLPQTMAVSPYGRTPAGAGRRGRDGRKPGPVLTKTNVKAMLTTTLIVPAFVSATVTSTAFPADTTEESHRRPRNQLVRVVTFSQDGLSEKPGQPMLDATLTRLDRAAAFKPDIVCLPEAFTRGAPETVLGPTTNRLSTWATRHRCYVICPIHVRDGERTFNSAVLVGRSGANVGRYDKIRPTEGELKRSICPGAVDPPVFQTDFGAKRHRIEPQVCVRGLLLRLRADDLCLENMLPDRWAAAHPP
jgi:hypothetical protein